jgi:hypothetical protein
MPDAHPGRWHMTVELLREVLGWCSVINIAILIWWWLWVFFAHDLMYRIHGKWFRISVETFDSINYGGMGLFKLAIIVFNLVPYIALRIVG